MTTTPIFAITLGEENQQLGWTTANELFRKLELLGLALQFITFETNTPPGSPSEGDTYWTGASPTGDWATHDYEIATYFNAAWVFFDPKSTGLDIHGIYGYRIDTDSSIVFSATTDTWVSATSDSSAIHDDVASEISAITEKATPVNADLVIIEDSADSNNKKRAQLGNLPGGGGSSLPVVDTTSIVEDPVDGTKEMRIDVGMVSTATVRVLTMPDQNIDLTPGTGDLASAAQGALADSALQSADIDTLAELNAIVGDATLDDASDSRAPTNHASDHTDGTDDVQNVTASQKGLMTTAMWDVLRQAEFFSAGVVIDFEDVSAEPGSPSEGDAYVLPASPTGSNWSGNGNAVALYKDAQWRFYTPANGMQLMVDQDGASFLSGERIAYSADESLWYPIQPLATATLHWTGKYTKTGPTRKVYSLSVSGTLSAAGSNTATAHGVTDIDWTMPVVARGMMTRASPALGLPIPQNFSAIVIEVRVNNTNVTVMQDGADLTAYDFEMRLECSRTSL